MSRPNYIDEKSPAEVANMSFEEKQFYLKVQDLKMQAARRFWSIALDEATGWYSVLNQLGHVVHPPSPLRNTRGFFESLPPQA